METSFIKLPLPIFYFLLLILCLYSEPFWASHAHAHAHAHTPCNGSISECEEAVENLMESEISRRFLEQRKYISSGALKKDEPVCNGGGGGEAYSKSEGCLPPQSNPYNRGCSKYYRCRSDS
ncbi:unnamed protein product [Ilex paraguariensis]|uniref:Protein RALF-like 32 n=1 Tax=Ilex paraguariensis TaxID=185542 RepID=A0ABC8T3L3_9AQUA